ncbi:MAG: YkgJ family cysteine cluster protein [Chloroflexi bacterium]|nr:YkgJ family cysteine cluster protein [Chloroflexota bacterium]
MSKGFQTDLEVIAAEAQRRADDYSSFRYYVELDERTDAELDRLVERIAAPVIAGIDCTTCANCCRHLNVYLTPDDVQCLSQGTSLSVDAVLDLLVDRERAQSVGEWGVFRDQPCWFLENNLCRVYPQRPESCRDYPAFTPDFRWLLEDILEGVGQCPIIYNVIEHLQAVLGW